MKNSGLLPDYRTMALEEVARLGQAGVLPRDAGQLCASLVTKANPHGTLHATQEHQIAAKHIQVAMGINPGDRQPNSTGLDDPATAPPLVAVIEEACHFCPETGGSNPPCVQACGTGALTKPAGAKVTIDADRCVTCGRCIATCPTGALADKTQFVPLFKLLHHAAGPVYATVAPATAGQFGGDITLGQLRAALRYLGFADMVEVALFADILTIKEALEFDHLVKTEEDFMITSCCCPVWVRLVETRYPDLLPRTSASVSPMIASGRVLKALEPQAKIVFIGPCVAKKAEARHPGLKGAVDVVLTFKELAALFAGLNINPAAFPPEDRHESSWGGRIYARTGGVSAAIQRTVAKLVPHRRTAFTAVQADGVPACQEILAGTRAGNVPARFIEGMACPGGCVGGPGVIRSIPLATRDVEKYSDDAPAPTPLDNGAVHEMLRRLGLPAMPLLADGGPISELLTREI